MCTVFSSCENAEHVTESSAFVADEASGVRILTIGSLKGSADWS